MMRGEQDAGMKTTARSQYLLYLCKSETSRRVCSTGSIMVSTKARASVTATAARKLLMAT